ncbi:MAG: TetR family transcriptional regulator [Frankiales bacterium]|nr:TetR family transcriptional regulator [Frankiales bacterium]
MADLATDLPASELARSERSGDRSGESSSESGTERNSERATDRAAATRQALLSAAHDVFTESSFADANVTDVVERAGASVGSLYHHFGGKGDVFLALFEDYQQRQEARATAAVRVERDAGERDPVCLFIAGTRAYFRGCWEERALTRLFLAGGGPAGFEMVARRRYRDWVRANEKLLRADDETMGEALVLVLTAVAAEAGLELAWCADAAAAARLGEDVLTLMARVAGQ